MLLVRTYIAPSAIHGIGLFAAAPIAAGTVLWRFAAPLDTRIPVGEIEGLEPLARATLARYGYRVGDCVFLCGDDARFMNHAPAPNCDDARDAFETVATRDIAEGEELTCDYRVIDDDWRAAGGPPC